jgi:hypothetical protein
MSSKVDKMAGDGITDAETPSVSVIQNNNYSNVEQKSESVHTIYENEGTGDLNDPTGEPASEHPVQSGEDFTVLTGKQKRLVIFTASLASIFSPMATSIYCGYQVKRFLGRLTLIDSDPSLDTISRDLNVSNTHINLTITLFLVHTLSSQLMKLG